MMKMITLLCPNKILYFFGVFVLLIFSNCRDKTNDNLYPVSGSSSEGAYDHIEVAYKDDSVIIIKWVFRGSGFVRESEIHIDSIGGYESNHLMTEKANVIKPERVLLLSTNDTSFIHRGSKFYPSVSSIYLIKQDCRYKIEKLRSTMNMTVISSLIDTSYKEIYYYTTERYRLVRFEYHDKGHKFEYSLTRTTGVSPTGNEEVVEN